jgi:serine/threonine protein kinase/ABC-type branched-subunit amino acid transport system substrate-binding protein
MKPGDEFDRYTIVRLLGRGGMGEVYRAHDKRLNRSVALKILRFAPTLDGDEADAKGRAEVVARTFREARAAAALAHPNVVVIHDVGESTIAGESEPTCFIAMEFLQGATLRAYIGKDAPIEERIRWLVDVARALAFAHERGVVHRDVKPDNIMVGENGIVKVLDFGIARRARSGEQAHVGVVLPTLTEKGLAMGSPRYMAPEQMLNEDLDGRADQYSWGLTAYELLAGKSPWSATTDSLQLVAQILTRSPEKLRSCDPSIPEAIAEVVDRTLSAKREGRFESMDDVIASLGGAPPPPTSRKLVVVAEPAEPPEFPTLRAQHSTPILVPLPPRPRRSRKRLFVAGAATVGLVALFVGLALRPRASPTLQTPAAIAAPRGCTSSAACTRSLGAPAVCRRRDAAADAVCVPLASDDCHVFAEPSDLTNDSTVWIGAMFPLSGEEGKSFGEREFQAVNLARLDFAQLMAGTSARPNGARPLALVACDDAADPARIIRHLADDVGVPAVIGFRSSHEVIELANSTFLPKGILGVAALNTSPLITSLPRAAGEPRMVWRTTYSGAELALPISLMIPEILEPKFRALPGAMATNEPLRVALVRQDDAAGIGFADVLFDHLRFNGRSALENESSYREFTHSFDAGGNDGGDDAEYAKIAAKLVEFSPHVVVSFDGNEAFARIVEIVERDWKNPAFRPRYVRASVLSSEISAFIGKSAERRRRFFFLTSVSATTANARFVSRYNEKFPEAAITRTFSPNSSYDAFYVVAYATYALGQAQVTGANLARAIPRLLPPGKAIDVGPSGIFDAFNTLASGANIDLNGATGPLDFDVATGEAPVDLAVLCVGVDPHGQASDSLESGVVYDATAHTLRGALHCP